MRRALLGRAARLARGATTGAIALVSLTTACASSQGGSAATQQGSGSRDMRYTLTSAELQEAGASNLLDAIIKLRPDFLRERGATTIKQEPEPTTSSTGSGRVQPSSGAGTARAVNIAKPALRIYENDVLLNNADDLRRIPVSAVVEVRFVPGPQAAVRYGTNHSGGALFVKTN